MGNPVILPVITQLQHSLLGTEAVDYAPVPPLDIPDVEVLDNVGLPGFFALEELLVGLDSVLIETQGVRNFQNKK